jgi:hypothetical protein
LGPAKLTNADGAAHLPDVFLAILNAAANLRCTVAQVHRAVAAAPEELRLYARVVSFSAYTERAAGMVQEISQVCLVLDAHGEDPERVAQDLHYLAGELLQLDDVSVERQSLVSPPPGTRSAGADTGALLIALGGSGATLPVLIALVRDWLSRRGSGVVRVKIGDDELELPHASPEMQKQVLDAFLGRHRD